MDGVADKRGIDGSDCQALRGIVVVNLRVVNCRHNYRDLRDLAYSSCLTGPPSEPNRYVLIVVWDSG